MAKSVYTIAPDIPFMDALAKGLLRETGSSTFNLSDILILLPTRRACLHLRETFRRHIKGPALLPRMQPIGDIDEDELYFTDVNPDIPPAIAPLRRQLLLARMIAQRDGLSVDQAALLAEALAHLLDEVQVERHDFSGLESLVEKKELAAHWQETVRFLKILTENWPKILTEEGCIDPADRRNRVLEAQAAAWRKAPPNTRVIAAGSTGSMPATAELLDVIAGLPRGAVILPGLDQTLPEDAWQEITETHPQYTMKKLLEMFGVKRANVKLWSAGKSGRAAHVRLLNESMRPADVSEAWRELKSADIPREALKGLTRLELDHPQEEAQAIALMMREVLETPGKTAALVTPDRMLAERVSGLLARWDIKVNDSGGTALTALPLGGLLIDVLKAAAPGASRVDILALLKHPLAACGLGPAECRARARQIETGIFRDRSSETKNLAAQNWLNEFKTLLQPLTETWRKDLRLAERIQAHIRVAEKIAATDVESGVSRLWKGEDGETAAEWLNDWQNAARDFMPLQGGEYLELFAGLARGVKIRPNWGLHPRLGILGPLEARLIHYDRMILGGMNEGVWPPETQADPWMSRPMKKDFGLPLPELRIGLSAHDFVQLASAPEVILARSRRVEGAPSVPSRFLLQLDAVLRALGYSDDETDALAPEKPWREWARMLDAPEKIAPATPPEPRPPAKLRPCELSVTEIGTWQRNPYAIYAKHVLKLRKLDPLEPAPDAADRGMIIHEALDAFVKKFPDEFPKNALEELLAIGRKIFAAYKEYPEVQAFWWPRFERIAAWFVETERAHRAAGITPVQAEVRGRIALGGFTLKGRADRIDRMPDGTLLIGDYKTGMPPTKKEIDAALEPQLPLLALIASEGGFDGVGAAPVSELAYWELSGGHKRSEIKTLDKDPAARAEDARQRVENLVKLFSDPATPYRAVPKPEWRPRYDDYAHLARLQEWGRTEEDT